MRSAPQPVEIFYLDDMEDEIIVTEMNLRRQNLRLNISFYLEEADMLAALDARRDKASAMPDLIVTDLNMPGKGGAHLVRSLRADPACRDVAIGVCTGSENPADHAEADAAGADFVVVKPFNRDTLADICRKTGRFQLVGHADGKDGLCATVIRSAA